MEKTIRIFGKEKTIKTEEKTQKFITWSYTKDGKKFYQVRFNQSADNVPKKSGYWKITVNTEDVSIKHGKTLENGVKVNDILWIANVISKEQDIEYEKEVAEKRANEIEEAL